MATLLDDKTVRALAAPATGNKITYDSELKGFGVRVTKAGAKAFVLNYRAGQKERRLTIGSFPDWSVRAARAEAATLKRRVDQAQDPMAERHADRRAPTIEALAEHYRRVHLPRKRPSSRESDEGLLRKHIIPALGRTKLEAVRHRDVAAMHREVSKSTPIAANRAVALLSKMFAIAIKEGWRTDNPTGGIERNPENRREQYLAPAEIDRLMDALERHANRQSANAIRLLLLTGARRGEVLGASWGQFDLEAGVWTKPAAFTKQKKIHRVPLSGAAIDLLRGMKGASDATLLFPGRGTEGAQAGLKRSWRSVRAAAGLDPGLHLHDLRHSFASVLASKGHSLPIIGQLLGHTQPSTTARYAHLLDGALRAATENVGEIVSRKRS